MTCHKRWCILLARMVATKFAKVEVDLCGFASAKLNTVLSIVMLPHSTYQHAIVHYLAGRQQSIACLSLIFAELRFWSTPPQQSSTGPTPARAK